jgi:hypothetical protein
MHNIEEMVHNVERHGGDDQYSNGKLEKYSNGKLMMVKLFQLKASNE